MSFWLAGLMALTLSAEAETQPAAVASTPAAPAVDTTPRLVNMTGQCWPELVPQGGLCEVVGTAMLASGQGEPITWALYEITGEAQYGLSVLLAPDETGHPKIAATLEVPPQKVETWRNDPYVIASVIERDEAQYVAVSVRGDDGPAAFSVHKIDPAGWTQMETTALWPAIDDKLVSVTGPGCYPIGGDMNWRTFALRYDMMNDNGTCGTAFLDLGVENGAVTVTGALSVKPDLTPLPRRKRGRR